MAFNLSAVSTAPTMKPPRLIVYGPHGIGKTTFASAAPAPILFPLEDGIGRLTIPHIPRDELKTYADVIGWLGSLLTNDHQYATVIIDSLDWLEPLVWAETCRRHGATDIEKIGGGFGKGYVAASDVWREFFDALLSLRDQKSMQVILLAHTEIKRFDDPSADPYDRYQIKLQPRAAALAQEWADAVLFANFKSYTKTTDAGFNRKVTRGVGLGERVAYTEERPQHYAKNRYALPPEIPFSYPAFEAALYPAT